MEIIIARGLLIGSALLGVTIGCTTGIGSALSELVVGPGKVGCE